MTHQCCNRSAFRRKDLRQIAEAGPYFARQIMKRSSGRHWAVLPGEPTRNEHRFLEEQQIECIDLHLEEFEGWLTA